jgi:hypothetical protein
VLVRLEPGHCAPEDWRISSASRDGFAVGGYPTAQTLTDRR